MNLIEPLLPSIIQELAKQHAALTAEDCIQKLSSVLLRQTLADRLDSTHHIHKTPRAVEAILLRYKKKLEV
jgi:hypothetical protein